MISRDDVDTCARATNNLSDLVKPLHCLLKLSFQTLLRNVASDQNSIDTLFKQTICNDAATISQYFGSNVIMNFPGAEPVLLPKMDI
ncbi:hypothetical protein YQ44_14385 [Janthinobacterium sp. 1_2014MBL_MicDiv]|nr:hypothetical protein YQ44_14385 [Janthinobacterium sp. 1_2014MBL_MicDiv]